MFIGKAWLRNWILRLLIIAFMFSLQVNTPSNANFLSNKIEEKPNLSKNIEITLIDTSRSVDKDVILQGLTSVREKIANVYEKSGGKYNNPAASYYFWLPILGQNDRKDFSALFGSKSDEQIWSTIRGTVGGRTNQINTLLKIRTDKGLWRELVLAGNIVNCLNYVAGKLKTQGLYGKALIGVSSGVCDQAIQARANYSNMYDTINDFLSGKRSNDGGSDIFGAIERVDDEMDSTSGLKKYKTVNLVFVTDGINNTKDYALRKLLSKSAPNACSLGSEKAQNHSKYNSKKVFVKMYGIGEGREILNGVGNDNLRIELKDYWTCYWKAKGIEKPEFGQLSELGVG
jgi:hypothetical protein